MDCATLKWHIDVIDSNQFVIGYINDQSQRFEGLEDEDVLWYFSENISTFAT